MATPDDDIGQLIERANAVLFGAEKNPREALAILDEAERLAEGLSGQDRETLLTMLQSYRSYAESYLLVGRDGDLARALSQAKEALRLADVLQQKELPAESKAGLDTYRMAVAAQALDLEIKMTEGPAREELQARRNALRDEMVSRLAPDDPQRLFFAALEEVAKAVALNHQSSAAFERFDLESASTYGAEAGALMERAKALFDRTNGQLPFIQDQITAAIHGLSLLQSAQQAIVTALHDAVVGRPSEKHANALLSAERRLLEGQEIIRASAPTVASRFEMIAPLPLDELHAAAQLQRDIARNVRNLIKEALSPKALARRATMRFPILVIALFAVMLAAIRVTGLVDAIDGGDAIKILLVAVIVSLTTSFGYEVALKFLPAFGFGSSSEDAAAK